MKIVHVRLSIENSLASIIADLDKQIPEATKQSEHFKALYEQTIDTIQSFYSKAEKIMKVGTTMRLEKSIQMPGCSVHILLDTTQKKSISDKIKDLFR